MPRQPCQGKNRKTAPDVRAMSGQKPTSIEGGYPVGQGICLGSCVGISSLLDSSRIGESLSIEVNYENPDPQ